ncbi:MAG TPA: prepilin-type N-terminal cleavage/methylation domain-containing protein, partial [Planctomycetota bacterium]|nr:prepilin-type N-terminal cleavage/methylation domain-containing protein [Planctomycetota bacterium]
MVGTGKFLISSRRISMRKSNKGFTLIELMIVIAIIAIIAAIAIPGLLSSQRASNERNASTSLKTLTSA